MPSHRLSDGCRDCRSLGSHYEYDAPTIKRAYGGKSIETYMAPGEQMGGTTHGVGWGRRNYHPGQTKGDNTDYGEYNLLMLEYLAGRPDPSAPVALSELLPVWQARLNGAWGAWKCSQTKQTLQQVAQGAPHRSLGGMSNAMSMRSAAALGAFDSEDAVAAAARAMMFTHRNEEALAGGEFFARVAYKVAREGKAPREAIDAAAASMSPWIQQQVAKGIAKFEEATDASRPLGKEVRHRHPPPSLLPCCPAMLRRCAACCAAALAARTASATCCECGRSSSTTSP